jgi:deazaflavin-dependent oxidoreductase (nitroreductase family)
VSDRQRRRAKWMGKYLVNPPTRALFRLGVAVPGTAILETTGRKSGLPRQTPVTDGLEGDVFWIVSEHGRHSAYVRNIEAEPRVRVKVGRRWHTGTAEILDSEDPAVHLQRLRSRAATVLNARTIGLVGTELLVLRVRLGG